MNDALIQTFALTFGFPYTQTRQELPPLEGGRHLHLGALDGFYRHMDGAWRSGYLERLGVWLGHQSRTISTDRRLARRMDGVWRNV